ncbi:MAG: 3-oxoacyl-ACP synthase [Deltaproteobacteria bacterium]|nr:3-oxoacyl-ACP synthase [Deltaproteobacteria bacterium]
MGLAIVGTGRHLPKDVATNEDLSRMMDTTAEWIHQRTGITERHFAAEGEGVSDLGAAAAERAIADAGLVAEDVDYVIMSTMTPDFHFPGPAAMVAAKLGIPGVPCLDVRQQCASFIYQLQLANALLLSGEASKIVLIGAEAHAGFMPWEDWDYLYGRGGTPPSKEAFERASRHRGLAILFGDGAGAVVIEKTEDARGVVGIDVHSDGRAADYIHIPSGFTKRPYAQREDIDRDLHIPRMRGMLFKQAVTRLPESVRALCERTGTALDDVDLFVAHQANDRINASVRDALGVPTAKVPSNIAKLGNTSAATIPILLDELSEQGRFHAGMLVCFLALGAGLHWGSALLRT